VFEDAQVKLRDMTEERSTISHLSVAMTTKDDNRTQSVSGNLRTIDQFHMQWVVVVIGVVGTVGNALILYALVASKQHKKYVLIFNQNALDLFSSFNLIISFAVKLCNIQLAGALGYWLCIAFYSEIFVWWGLIGSVVNLAIITIDRYLKVIHHTWRKTSLRPWMINSAMAFAWFVGIVSNTPFMLATSGLIDGECYTWILYHSRAGRISSLVWYVVSFYIIILVIFVYCYGRILAAIRRQARVAANQSTAGASTCQSQLNPIQSSVIKTMLLVSAFYAIAWLPVNIYHLSVMLDQNLTYFSSYYYASMFVAFLYTCTNPFIYALEFHPVKQILRDMIPCKNESVQPTIG